MEDLPKIGEKKRLPLSLSVKDYLRDHVFNGRAVFPAVEAMQVLAGSARDTVPGLDVNVIAAADFNKFLVIDPAMAVLEAFNELERDGTGDIISRLVTVRKQGTTSITRAVDHVTLRFPGARPSITVPPLDDTLGLEGICLHPGKDDVYRDLVPFQPAYRNIETLHVSEQGALALVNGGTAEAPAEPLGSPFPLDAAFHAACVWGQRHAGIVGFPVHIDERYILKKTGAGATYITRVTPRSADGALLVFDLWIYDGSGDLCESVRGLHMRDVSGGKLHPPHWIRSGAGDPLEKIRARCHDMAIIELDTITAPCEKIFSVPERERSASMREKRRLTFCSARLALKKLSRRMAGSDMTAPPETITTIHPDGRPRCPGTDGAETMRCTASHDSRFAVAALSEHPIGIDVEEITPRVLKGREHYMNPDEIALVKGHPLGEMEACLRVWSAKEAVSKASGLHLVETWRKSTVKKIGANQSIIAIEGKNHKALHGIVEGHMVTLVVL
ncbi:MAG TPA: polyketide synthase dehydratase domain-containing protein [Spirochaetota bacterium]|nr:polyketide synthase dehydratase domain-containing protein [Spirochaetota bacterium]HPL16856.1 polyketide synthase dehydratase domain-containing protein [Spirochaetota bacterium]HRS76690.1 polyketide synthase dehydratase domain-containing protein [Spirochaetota bacterium]HRT74143.1 polyketide synthase dehydratase domain-containing protein [Spirochaetota bacterium]